MMTLMRKALSTAGNKMTDGDFTNILMGSELPSSNGYINSMSNMMCLRDEDLNSHNFVKHIKNKYDWWSALATR